VTAHDVMAQIVESSRVKYIKHIIEPSLLRVVFRKHVDHFLDEAIKKGYKLIVWSAGLETYVKDLTSILFKDRPYAYVLTRKDLINDVKNLKVIERSIPGSKVENMRLVDDNLGHSVGQEGSFIHVKAFEYRGPDDDDDELLTLLDRVDASMKS
jgi:hypothetical protein